MKLSNFELSIDDGNIIVRGPEGFADGISDNEQFLVNHNLAYLLLLIKKKVSSENWNEIVQQIKEM